MTISSVDSSLLVRRNFAGPVLVVFALLVAACGVSRDGASGAIATIEYGAGDGASTIEIEQSELDVMVNSIIGSAEFRELAYGPAATDDEIRADLLTRLVYERVIERELEANGVDPADVDTTEARAALQLQLEGAFAAEADPVAYAADVAQDIEPFLAPLAGIVSKQERLGEVLIEADGPAETIEVPCARHILLDATDTDLADDLIAQLEDGADFAELAAANSTGPSGPNGGDLGCADPNNYVPEFRDAVIAAEVGEIVGPVETQFGLHIIIVESVEEQAVGAADPNARSGQVIQESLTEAVIIGSADSGLVWEPGAQAFIVANG